MSTKPTDGEILSVLRERAGGVNPTYYVKNMLRIQHKGLETPFVLRRLKALEKDGKVERVRTNYVTQICWNIVKAPA
jgi:DNA-binding HxlR family transcriptional regulator